MLKRVSVRTRGVLTPYSSTADASLIFTPTHLSNLKLWLYAGSLGLNDGDAVSSWTDLSGNSFHHTQSNAGNRPLLKTNILNGLPVVRFDGSDDYVNYEGAILGTGNQPFTLFAVVKSNSNSTSPEILQLGQFNNNDTAGYQCCILSDGTMYFGASGTANNRQSAASTVGTGAWNVLCYELASGAFSSTNPKFYKNAVQQTSSQGSGTGTPNLSLQRSRVGCNLTSPTPGQQWSGDMAEIIVYNSVLSTADRQRVESYLISKYAL